MVIFSNMSWELSDGDDKMNTIGKHSWARKDLIIIAMGFVCTISSSVCCFPPRVSRSMMRSCSSFVGKIQAKKIRTPSALAQCKQCWGIKCSSHCVRAKQHICSTLCGWQHCHFPLSSCVWRVAMTKQQIKGLFGLLLPLCPVPTHPADQRGFWLVRRGAAPNKQQIAHWTIRFCQELLTKALHLCCMRKWTKIGQKSSKFLCTCSIALCGAVSLWCCIWCAHCISTGRENFPLFGVRSALHVLWPQWTKLVPCTENELELRAPGTTENLVFLCRSHNHFALEPAAFGQNNPPHAQCWFLVHHGAQWKKMWGSVGPRSTTLPHTLPRPHQSWQRSQQRADNFCWHSERRSCEGNLNKTF